MHAIEALGDVPHSVLLTTVHSLDDSPHFLASAVSIAAAKTTTALRIVVVSPLFNPPAPAPSPPANAAPAADSGLTLGDARAVAPGISRTAHWDAVQRLLTFVYVQATKVAQDADRVLLDVDVLLRGTAEPFPEDVLDGAPRAALPTARTRHKGVARRGAAAVLKTRRAARDDFEPRISPRWQYPSKKTAYWAHCNA